MVILALIKTAQHFPLMINASSVQQGGLSSAN